MTVGALVRAFGSAAGALSARSEHFAAIAGREATRARGDRRLRTTVIEAVRRAETLGISVMSWSDDRYPAGLLHLADPPPVLFLP